MLVLPDELGQVLARAAHDHAIPVKTWVDGVDNRRVRDYGIPLGVVGHHRPAQIAQLRQGFVLVASVRLTAVRHTTFLSPDAGRHIPRLRARWLRDLRPDEM
ncbi:hypothetical protein ACFU98_45875 [Streptomyces sp. NPDC057575]|uniref:hypothetical protein n=1 Tax=unclassified Streptomyces TaxID=2593676 RepID=UPI0036AE241A